MRTTVEFEGIDELILTKAVELGLARSKTSALRMGVFALNREYKLVKDIELELVERKIMKEKGKMNKKGEKYLSEEKALAEYK
ncbi:MAG: hypothetical protein COT90_02070 [Candidatus Diapherotrites archaeon CG10_big_fil_rev_8_21_14_0_10_31_34]|nr:MAG: hypothetical protein COT90_02070 [Candidatus Diapherotrites archaeon CG10_big_fil_rev_8_21_14_0_10_31_34]